MERKASIARSDLHKLLVDETAEPKALPLSLLEDITDGFSDDQEIGRGGFAVVYKGILGDRVVAVKRLSNAFMDEMKFHREIECLMQVKHKNVVRFLGYCADRQGNMERYNGKLVMADVHQRLLCFEYIPKQGLDKYITDAHREWGMCYKIIKGICAGLQYLHENHIVHLDLKPANILLDNNMIPKITDFGLSRCFDENQSHDITKTILGTIGYMAPELREGGVIACSSDLHSLGVIIIEILTGQKGYQPTEDVLESWSDRLEKSQRHMLCEQIRLCYEIALECKEFNPKKRPASALSIIDRLQVMESILMAEAASSISGVAATESKEKGNTDNPGRGAHPLAGQMLVTPRATSISPQRATLHAMVALHPPPGKTIVLPCPTGPAQPAPTGSAYGLVKTRPPLPAKHGALPLAGQMVVMPRAAPSSPQRATLHAMVALQPPQGQIVVIPRPAVPAVSTGSAYDLVETRPLLPAKLGPRSAAAKFRLTYGYDMVEPMSYLYVSVVKARDLPTMGITGSLNPFVEVKLGKFMGVTTLSTHLENTNPVWRQTFAFSCAHFQSNQLEVIVKDKDVIRNGFVGRVVFDMSDVPIRLLPDSPLAPLWYHLSDAHGNKLRGEIMLAVWLGTQADKAFSEAWHPEASSLSPTGLTHTRSQVYLSPKLIYLKVSVIDAQDLDASEKGWPLVAVKIQMGNQIQHTRLIRGTANPMWNEEFLFVASEPFQDQDPLVVTVVGHVRGGIHRPISGVLIPLQHIPRNDVAKSLPSKWFNRFPGMTVDKAAAYVTTGINNRESSRTFTTKIQLKLSLETAYHVVEGSLHCSSDLQPAAKDLWTTAIGILEVGIISVRGLAGMNYPYVVANYGAKWVRTRTLLATMAPHWNEQYTWEVFDLSTCITVAVFHNANIHGHAGGGAQDQRIGKLRIRLATLESDKLYTHYYPLMALTPSGVKKTGELHLAVRFTCTAWANMLEQYIRPRLPKMHYTNPIGALQTTYVRCQAAKMVTTRLVRADPPLQREVVEYILEDDVYMFSLRRNKANLHRMASLFSGVAAAVKLFEGICKWKNPLATMLVHVMFLQLVCHPELILPMVFLCMSMIGVWNYRGRPQTPPCIDPVLSQAEEFNTSPPPNIDPVLDSMLWYADHVALLDELDEEFDTFPTSRPHCIVRIRYDRLRKICGRLQTMAGDLATQGERVQSLLSWRDPRATAIFIVLSLVVAVVLYLTPFRTVAMVMVLYFLRPPWLRSRTCLLLNFYRRLPSQDDLML